MSSEYIIYADESEDKGKYFTDFYGGVLLNSSDLAEVQAALEGVKVANNLFREVKWNKVTEPYLGKYVAFVDVFFDLLAADKAKMRVMFQQRAWQAVNLTQHHADRRYHLLYYQFIKHAFGLRFAGQGAQTRVRIYLDRMPCSRHAADEFKSFLVGLNSLSEFRDARLVIQRDQIAEVNSHDHVVMQALDVVLGAIQFRLNNKHLEKPEGSHRRGKRTIAKEKLFKHISSRIRRIYPNFNVGESTGKQGDWQNFWFHPYRHWKFIPSGAVRDETLLKP